VALFGRDAYLPELPAPDQRSPTARTARANDRRVITVWNLSSSSDPAALAVVDGTGEFEQFGPHYSRRTPGSRTFTGVGQEIVLLSDCGRAVWACVRQKTPAARGSGSSRGREGQSDGNACFIWRNMLFRNLGAGLSSELIISATTETYRHWAARYGALPAERLRTEIGLSGRRTGYCYRLAGWENDRVVRGKLYMWAPLT
jgi:hypothetical protein